VDIRPQPTGYQITLKLMVDAERGALDRAEAAAVRALAPGRALRSGIITLWRMGR